MPEQKKHSLIGIKNSIKLCVGSLLPLTMFFSKNLWQRPLDFCFHIQDLALQQQHQNKEKEIDKNNAHFPPGILPTCREIA